MGGITQTPGLGIGQNWVDVLGSRTKNTAVQNTTGKPILVAIGVYQLTAIAEILVSADNSTFYVAGNAFPWAASSSERSTIYAVVPPNHYYKTNAFTASTEPGLTFWSELR